MVQKQKEPARHIIDKANVSTGSSKVFRPYRIRPQSAAADVQQDDLTKARQRSSSTCTHLESAGNRFSGLSIPKQVDTVRVSNAGPTKKLWEWPKLGEMRMSAFDEDPALRDSDETQRPAEEILGQV